MSLIPFLLSIPLHSPPLQSVISPAPLPTAHLQRVPSPNPPLPEASLKRVSTHNLFTPFPPTPLPRPSRTPNKPTRQLLVFSARLLQLMFHRSRNISSSTSDVDSSIQRPMNASRYSVLFFLHNSLARAVKPATSVSMISISISHRPATTRRSNIRAAPKSFRGGLPT